MCNANQPLHCITLLTTTNKSINTRERIKFASRKKYVLLMLVCEWCRLIQNISTERDFFFFCTGLDSNDHISSRHIWICKHYYLSQVSFYWAHISNHWQANGWGLICCHLFVTWGLFLQYKEWYPVHRASARRQQSAGGVSVQQSLNSTMLRNVRKWRILRYPAQVNACMFKFEGAGSLARPRLWMLIKFWGCLPELWSVVLKVIFTDFFFLQTIIFERECCFPVG